jgi:HSP20 family protein
MAPCNRIRKGYLRPIRPIDGHPPLLNIVNPPLLGLALGAWERQPAVKYHGRMRGLLCSKPCAPGSSHSYSEGDDTMLFSDPFEALFNLQQALDTFRQSDWLERSTSGTGPFPPVNAFRKGDDFVIIAEVPGVKKSDLDIQVKDQVIRIAGSKSVNYGDKASLHRRERSPGRFDRTFTLPIRVDAEQIKAECKDGILALYLPRAERDKPRSIKIA